MRGPAAGLVERARTETAPGPYTPHDMATLELVHDPGGPAAVTPTRRPPGREEQRLARGLVAGDPDALRELHAEFAGTVFGYLLGALADRATAEDVCQQVFTEVWTRGRTYDIARASLLTWIMTIARSRAIDELRRRRPVPHAPEDAALLADATAVPPETDALLERWEMAHLLGHLDPGDADLLRLRFYEELTQTEIAARTGLPLGTVKTRMVRGLDRMRDLLAAADLPAPSAGRPALEVVR